MNAPSTAPRAPTVSDVLDLTHRICQLSRIYAEATGNPKLPKPDNELANALDDRRARLRNLLLRDLDGRITLKAELSSETIKYYREIHALLHQ